MEWEFRGRGEESGKRRLYIFAYLLMLKPHSSHAEVTGDRRKCRNDI